MEHIYNNELSAEMLIFLSFHYRKNQFYGGGLEIRTLARLAPTNGFRNRPLQPLG